MRLYAPLSLSLSLCARATGGRRGRSSRFRASPPQVASAVGGSKVPDVATPGIRHFALLIHCCGEFSVSHFLATFAEEGGGGGGGGDGKEVYIGPLGTPPTPSLSFFDSPVAAMVSDENLVRVFLNL